MSIGQLKTATIDENKKLHGISGHNHYVWENTERPTHQNTRK